MFIEDEGEILFYKNRAGEAIVDVDEKLKANRNGKPVDGTGQEEMIIDWLTILK